MVLLPLPDHSLQAATDPLRAARRAPRRHGPAAPAELLPRMASLVAWADVSARSRGVTGGVASYGWQQHAKALHPDRSALPQHEAQREFVLLLEAYRVRAPHRPIQGPRASLTLAVVRSLGSPQPDAGVPPATRGVRPPAGRSGGNRALALANDGAAGGRRGRHGGVQPFRRALRHPRLHLVGRRPRPRVQPGPVQGLPGPRRMLPCRSHGSVRLDITYLTHAAARSVRAPPARSGRPTRRTGSRATLRPSSGPRPPTASCCIS